MLIIKRYLGYLLRHLMRPKILIYCITKLNIIIIIKKKLSY